MSDTLLRIPNAPDGFLDISSDQAVVNVRLLWPFDRSEDEWIRLDDTFDRTAFATAVREAASSSGRGEVESRTSRLVILRRDNDFSIDFATKGSMPTRAILDFPSRHLSELITAVESLDAVN